MSRNLSPAWHALARKLSKNIDDLTDWCSDLTRDCLRLERAEETETHLVRLIAELSNERDRLQKQVTELQEHSTKQLEEIRSLGATIANWEARQ